MSCLHVHCNEIHSQKFVLGMTTIYILRFEITELIQNGIPELNVILKTFIILVRFTIVIQVGLVYPESGSGAPQKYISQTECCEKLEFLLINNQR